MLHLFQVGALLLLLPDPGKLSQSLCGWLHHGFEMPCLSQCGPDFSHPPASVPRSISAVPPLPTTPPTNMFRCNGFISTSSFTPSHSLAPLSLFLIYGPDLKAWPDCWVSAEFLRAPIPRKGLGSTTTTTTLRGLSLRHCSGGKPLAALCLI